MNTYEVVADVFVSKPNLAFEFLTLIQVLIQEWKRNRGTAPLLKELAGVLSPSRPNQEAQRLSQIFKRAGVGYAELVERADGAFEQEAPNGINRIG